MIFIINLCFTLITLYNLSSLSLSYISYTNLSILSHSCAAMEMKEIQPIGKPLLEHFNHKKYIEKLEIDTPT